MAGFRRGIGTINKIYVLNYVVNKELQRKGGKMLAFVDFRAAFDLIDKKLLWKTLEKRGVSQELSKRIKKVYKETICKVKAKGK